MLLEMTRQVRKLIHKYRDLGEGEELAQVAKELRTLADEVERVAREEEGEADTAPKEALWWWMAGDG